MVPEACPSISSNARPDACSVLVGDAEADLHRAFEAAGAGNKEPYKATRGAAMSVMAMSCMVRKALLSVVAS